MAFQDANRKVKTSIFCTFAKKNIQVVVTTQPDGRSRNRFERKSAYFSRDFKFCDIDKARLGCKLAFDIFLRGALVAIPALRPIPSMGNIAKLEISAESKKFLFKVPVSNGAPVPLAGARHP